MYSMICPVKSCSKVIEISTVIAMGGICPMCYADIRAEVEIWYPQTADSPGRVPFEEEAVNAY